jgi:catechol 2,3-dioxygenase-like lactoylglutathione lyase family enzyme
MTTTTNTMPITDVRTVGVAARDGVQAGVETGIRFITADVDADHAALRSRGVDTGEVLRWDGVPPMFAFRDPDGNGLEIVEQP